MINKKFLQRINKPLKYMDIEIQEYLRKQSKQVENSAAPWSKENILAGFQKFFVEKNRYPTADEIDAYEYLPSSRQIQRSFGGLVNIRKLLGMEIADYGIGPNRSKISFEINKRGGMGEKEMEELLVKHFGEHFVHVEKPLYKYLKPEVALNKGTKNRADFLIFAKNYTFCVDVFYTTQNFRQLTANVNIKSKKYANLLIDVFLVNLNETGVIREDAIAKHLKNKHKQLEPNVKVLNKVAFLELIRKTQPIEIRL